MHKIRMHAACADSNLSRSAVKARVTCRCCLLQTWAAFYQGRWRLPQAAVLGGMRWQEVYGTKMRLAQAWHGRFKQDLLYGHRGGVRSTALLPSCQLLATGGPELSQDCCMQKQDLRRCHLPSVFAQSVDLSHGLHKSAMPRYLCLYKPTNAQGMEASWQVWG